MEAAAAQPSLLKTTAPIVAALALAAAMDLLGGNRGYFAHITSALVIVPWVVFLAGAAVSILIWRDNSIDACVLGMILAIVVMCPLTINAGSKVEPSLVSPVAINGSARVGQMLATTANKDGSFDSAARISYSWQRCRASCTAIKDATANAYLINSADRGYRLRLQIRVWNHFGSRSYNSPLTALVS